jgi:hypothetical protein
MLFDRARLRAWFARKDPIDVALDLVAELRLDIRVLQRRLAEIPEVVTTMREHMRGRKGAAPTRRKHHGSDYRGRRRRQRASTYDYRHG